MNTSQKTIKMTFWSLLLLVLFSYPVAAAFNKPILVFGIPLTYVYLFVVWLAFIVVLFQLAHSKSNRHE